MDNQELYDYIKRIEDKIDKLNDTVTDTFKEYNDTCHKRCGNLNKLLTNHVQHINGDIKSIDIEVEKVKSNISRIFEKFKTYDKYIYAVFVMLLTIVGKLIWDIIVAISH